ncbi:MAG TPA: ATP-binding cassette domain-containing protein [Solirubrobacteraceae bacterium]|nr:ATP-binding cassette domain-containing protein [Solirubrobacteraceae bacterium]
MTLRPVVDLHDVFSVHRTGQGDAAALQGADLDVAVGEVLCVLGPSGAGKSTLLRVIAGLQTPSAGVVRVMGTDLGRRGERARAAFRYRHLGLLGQSSESLLSPDLSVAEAVEMPLALRGESSATVRGARVRELLDAVGLGDRRHAIPRELSGGERQRAALCAAIAHRPSLLLADEPTGELDASTAEEILRLIPDLANATRMSVIIATHDQAVARFADRTVTIAGGRIAEERRDGEASVVVSRGGWMRLPPRLRSSSGIGKRVRVDSLKHGLSISPVGGFEPGTAALSTPIDLPSDSTPARVELERVAFAYAENGRERVVLTDLSHKFASGAMTVISGRSGSGKTTLLRLIAGLDRPDSGELLIDDRPLTTADREDLAALRRQRIGYMPQESTAIGFLSAQENVVVALRLRGVDQDDATERAVAVLAALSLSERVRQRVARLSAGETQRVALARALASSRGLLILDEPTSRLDEVNAATVAALLAAAARTGQTIICATHDPQLISHADELVRLS